MKQKKITGKVVKGIRVNSGKKAGFILEPPEQAGFLLDVPGGGKKQ